MSTAYYALFHETCRTAAGCLIGSTRASRSQPAWLQAYRAVEHRAFDEVQRKGAVLNRFPAPVQEFVALLVEAKEARHRADYDPAARFTLSDTLTMIERVESAISNLREVGKKDRTAFAAFVVFRRR